MIICGRIYATFLEVASMVIEVIHCEIFETVKPLLEASCGFFTPYNQNREEVLSIIGAPPA
jgi:hypothetical protein